MEMCCHDEVTHILEVSKTESRTRPAGIKKKVDIDYIVDVEQEIHLNVTLLICYEDDEAKKLIGLDGCSHLTIHPEDCHILYPTVHFVNTRSVERTGGYNLLVSTRTGMVYIIQMYRVVLKDSFDMHRFPFDRQIFNVTIQSFQLEFLQEWPGEFLDLPSGFRADPLWGINDHVVELEGDEWILQMTKGKVNTYAHPSTSTCAFGLTRNSEYYMANVFLIMFFIVQCSISVVAIEHYFYGERGSLAFTTLLTVVAFKFVISQDVPKTSYFTYLDIYVLLGFFIVFLVILENFIVSQLFFDNLDPTTEMIDFVFGCFLSVVWCGSFIYVSINAYFGKFHEPWSKVWENEEKVLRKHRLEVKIANEIETDLGVKSIYTPSAPVNYKKVNRLKSSFGGIEIEGGDVVDEQQY